MILLDTLALLSSVYVTNMAQNYLGKLELLFQIYATIGLITISTVITLSAHVVWKTKPLFIFDVTVFPDEHLYHILIYGSNVYNSVSNGLIGTIKYIRNSGRFTELEAFR